MVLEISLRKLADRCGTVSRVGDSPHGWRTLRQSRPIVRVPSVPAGRFGVRRNGRSGGNRSPQPDRGPVAGPPASTVPCVDHLFGSGSATGGHHITFRVRLSAPAPTGGAKIALGSSKAAITVPATVTVPAGATEYTFSAATHPVAADTVVVVSASTGACRVSRSVTVKAPVLRSLSVQTVIRGGGQGKITVCLNGADGEWRQCRGVEQ